MTEVTELINYLNQSGGIPLNVTQVTQTAAWQFYLTLVISGFFILYFMINVFGVSIHSSIAKIYLRIFKWKNKTRNIMVIKHTTAELFNQSMIDRKTLESIQKALIKYKGKPFDLILYTPGGEIFSAVYISRLLKKYTGSIRSFIPTFAMSGGTLLALSTDEIYMNDYSCLGAVDPQFGNLFKVGSARSWKEVLKVKGKKAEDSSISFKFIGEQYTKSMKEEVSNLIDDKIHKGNKKKLVNLLISGDIEHGFNMTKDFLKLMGMKIGDIEGDSNNKLIKLVNFMPQGVTFI